MFETMPISKSESPTSWIPVSQAARRLKVSRQRAYQLLDQGLIHGRKVESTWLVSSRSVDARIVLLLTEGGA